jgi:hypothetical protein
MQTHHPNNSFDCRVERKTNSPLAPSAEKAKEGKNNARFTKIQEEALNTLHEIATNSQNRIIYTTSHKLGTILFSYMQQTGISQRDAEQSRIYRNKPKMTSKCTNTEPRHHGEAIRSPRIPKTFSRSILGLANPRCPRVRRESRAPTDMRETTGVTDKFDSPQIPIGSEENNKPKKCLLTQIFNVQHP